MCVVCFFFIAQQQPKRIGSILQQNDDLQLDSGPRCEPSAKRLCVGFLIRAHNSVAPRTVRSQHTVDRHSIITGPKMLCFGVQIWVGDARVLTQRRPRIAPDPRGDIPGPPWEIPQEPRRDPLGDPLVMPRGIPRLGSPVGAPSRQPPSLAEVISACEVSKGPREL